jgi:hypothetical protein
MFTATALPPPTTQPVRESSESENIDLIRLLRRVKRRLLLEMAADTQSVQAARPIQKVSNGAVALCDLEPPTLQLSRAQAA